MDAIILSSLIAISCSEPTMRLKDFQDKFYGPDVHGEEFYTRAHRHLVSMDVWLDYVVARIEKCGNSTPSEPISDEQHRAFLDRDLAPPPIMFRPKREK